MTFTPTTTPSVPGSSGSGGYLSGDNLNSFPTKLRPSSFIDYSALDHSWAPDIFANTNGAQQTTADEPHPFGRAFPMAPHNFSSLLSSTFDSIGNTHGRPSIPWMFGSLFRLAPTIISPALATSNEPPTVVPMDEGRTDKGKGKARAADSDDTHQPESEPVSMEGDAFADTLREAMTVSRRASSRVRSSNEAGPSGTSTSTLTSDTAPPPFRPALLSHVHSDSGSEQAEINRAILISSLEHIENSLHTLRANFIFPTRLDLHQPSNTGSHASSPTGEDTDWVAYLPTTSVNGAAFDFVRDVRGLSRQLDRVDGKNDAEAVSMKEKIARAINGALEDVESEVEEAIGKWMSVQATGVGATGR